MKRNTGMLAAIMAMAAAGARVPKSAKPYRATNTGLPQTDAQRQRALAKAEANRARKRSRNLRDATAGAFVRA